MGRTVRLCCVAATLGLLTSGAVPAQDPAAGGSMTVELARKTVDEIVPEVEKIRGLSFEKNVPVSVINDAEAREHILARIDRFEIKEQLERSQRAYGCRSKPTSDLR